MKASALVKTKGLKTESVSSLVSSQTSSSFGSFVSSSCLLSTENTVRGGTIAHIPTVSSHCGSSSSTSSISISASTQQLASVTSSQQDDSAFQGGFQKASTLYLATHSSNREPDHKQSTSSSYNSGLSSTGYQELMSGYLHECSSKTDKPSTASQTQQKTSEQSTAQPTQKITYFFERFVRAWIL